MPIRLAIFAWLSLPLISFGQNSSIPQLASRPGAAYTVYLNFGGFSFQGLWGNQASQVPGVTPAYTVDGTSTSFSATEISNMQNIYARTAEKYAALNVNVTTVDPAPVNSTDAQRQAFYDSTPRLMHTVIGGSGGWIGGGGISYLGTTENTYGTSSNSGAGAGYKTNFVFSAQSPSNLQFVAEATAHEQGHGLQLDHQSRWNGSTFSNQYDTGNGSVAPIMGNSYTAQRGVWRIGATPGSNSTSAQNDLALLRSNNEMAGNGAGGFMDSGIGHTTATATALPLTGATINSALALGLITPNSATPVAIGEANYTTDLFKFSVTDIELSRLNVSLISGGSKLAAGVADQGATLNATLRLLDNNGATIITSSSGVLSETILTDLALGDYFLQISSAGGQTDSRGYQYFDVGSYFLTGSFSPVPEPLFVMMGLAVIMIGGRFCLSMSR